MWPTSRGCRACPAPEHREPLAAERPLGSVRIGFLDPRRGCAEIVACAMSEKLGEASFRRAARCA